MGEPDFIRPAILESLKASDIIPVIAPVGASLEGETYNINADTAAGAIASALSAERLFILTDVAGVLDPDGNLIDSLTIEQARRLIKNKVAKGGMIPKLETCIKAVEKGAGSAVIIDGRLPHSLLLEMFTERGAGTIITRD